mmetsp:Transcript_173208/g.549904  ORF Transcript_173208/g.549904 Transcript_173208/m.549904 type:complete len:202 (+) Transcript_173208:193-798(+)
MQCLNFGGFTVRTASTHHVMKQPPFEMDVPPLIGGCCKRPSASPAAALSPSALLLPQPLGDVLVVTLCRPICCREPVEAGRTDVRIGAQKDSTNLPEDDPMKQHAQSASKTRRVTKAYQRQHLDVCPSGRSTQRTSAALFPTHSSCPRCRHRRSQGGLALRPACLWRPPAGGTPPSRSQGKKKGQATLLSGKSGLLRCKLT